MNLNEVTTPAELLSANELTPQQKAAQALLDLNWEETKELVELVLEGALDWHKHEGIERLKQHEPSTLAWARDVGVLESVLALLQTVK